MEFKLTTVVELNLFCFIPAKLTIFIVIGSSQQVTILDEQGYNVKYTRNMSSKDVKKGYSISLANTLHMTTSLRFCSSENITKGR